MGKELQKVVIDADFFRHTTDYEMGTGLFEKILAENFYYPVMHKFVASVELKSNARLEELVRKKKIEVIGEKEFLGEQDKEDYFDYFHQAYERLNQLQLDDDEDVMSYGYDGRASGQSLGEIRSGYMARKLGYRILVSDDGHSKVIVNILSSEIHPLKRKTLYDLLLDNRRSNGNICWNDIKASIPKVYKNDKARCDELCNLYRMATGEKR